MEQPQLYFQFPSSIFFALPVIVVLVILPVILLIVLFRRTKYKTWLKIVLTPVCLLGPVAATTAWPLLIHLSGVVGATGGDGKVTYDIIATKIFGDYSEYVWGGITTIIVFLIYRKTGLKSTSETNKA
ncbi:MAG TPA: hypothetical protein ENG78_04760 [Acidiferrobacteraceae bacterium]|nr:hypothetical protein [Acidiferrobacteraceae bacterium]HEX20111.1 hypothetical protein [Acidiferrobacteraceae bacterium]